MLDFNRIRGLRARARALRAPSDIENAVLRAFRPHMRLTLAMRAKGLH